MLPPANVHARPCPALSACGLTTCGRGPEQDGSYSDLVADSEQKGHVMKAFLQLCTYYQQADRKKVRASPSLSDSVPGLLDITLPALDIVLVLA